MAYPKDPLKLASQVLGVEVGAPKSQIQYSYYRLMVHHHPDRNHGDPQAHRLAALINEAKDVLMGKETQPSLLQDRGLIAELLRRPVSDEKVLSYEEWLKKRFYSMEQCSIWPC